METFCFLGGPTGCSKPVRCLFESLAGRVPRPFEELLPERLPARDVDQPGEERRLTEHKGALYNLFETQFGTRMVRAEEKLKALNADAASAELLAVAPGHALLEVERLSYTYGDRPVEWRRGLYKTDRYFYRSELG